MTFKMHDWKGKKVLVIGDIMLDVFKEGKIKRINPESPASQLIDVQTTRECLGGAANVASNLATLGCAVTLHGIATADQAGRRIQDLSKSTGINLVMHDDGRRTTIKTRLIETTMYHQIARIDEEDNHKITKEFAEKVFQSVKKDITYADAIVLSDYNKGLLIKELSQSIILEAKQKGIPILVDFRPVNIQNFRGCTALCPNIGEAQAVTGMEIKRTNGLDEDQDLKEMCRRLKAMTDSECSIITCGKDGILSMSKEGTFHFSHTEAKKIYDVTGAGDTVMAVFGAYFAATYKTGNVDLREVTKIANIAGKIVVGKVGTSTVTVEEIEQELTRK